MGMSGDTALTLAKSYVKKTLQGQGALKGQDGFSPIITENHDNTDEIYKLDITTKDGTFTTPNLIGADGSGEENVIESIKVNGVAQNVATDKSVDITVPTKTSDLSNDSNYQTADDITDTLAPYAKSADVSTEITTEIAKVVADAPEDLNTLKEMSDWIAGHENDASAMNSAISDNKTAITALQKGKADKSEIPTTLPADGGNADTVNNHTVKSDVPENAVFTDTVYDDTDIKEEFNKVDNKLTTNLLNPTLGTVTRNGITCTANGDGTYTLNGTAIDKVEFVLSTDNTLVKDVHYLALLANNFYDGLRMYIQKQLNPWAIYYTCDSGSIIDVVPTENLSEIRYVISINKDTILDNVIVKPMITTNLNATYDDFVPYTGSTGQINSDVAEINNNLGGLSFSVSDGTLSITDGTNTWTLPQTT